MMSPLEYLFFALLSSQNPDPAVLNGINGIEPAAGNTMATQTSLSIRPDGHVESQTILMEPRDPMNDSLEAPIRISADLVPMFRIGAPVTITIDETGNAHKARVVRIENIIDGSGQSVQVIAGVVRSKSGLQPGMTGIANIATIH